MKVQTEYGEQEIEEVIRCYNLWKALMKKNIEKRHEFNQTEEGKQKNRERAKIYYERNRDLILEKRRLKREAEDS